MLSHYHIPPRGCSAPSESEPIPPEASPLLGHGPVECPFQTFVRRLVGHRRPHLQGFTAWMSPPCRPESFLLSSNLLGLLDQNCSSPSFAWSVHNYMDWLDVTSGWHPGHGWPSRLTLCLVYSIDSPGPSTAFLDVLWAACSVASFKEIWDAVAGSWLYSQTPLPPLARSPPPCIGSCFLSYTNQSRAVKTAWLK